MFLHMGIAFRLNPDGNQAFQYKKGQKQSNSREKMQNSVNYYLISIAMNFLRWLSYFRRITVSETLKATFFLFRLDFRHLRGTQARTRIAGLRRPSPGTETPEPQD
jgi:hypothetical protein